MSQSRVLGRGTACRTIITDRLVLRPSKEERDLENYLNHIEAEDEFIFQYGREKSDELLGMIDFHTAPVAYFTVFLKGTRTMVGYVGVTTADGGTLDEGNLEYYIFKEYRRNGFCKEAAQALIQSFFSGTLTGRPEESVFAQTLSENEASIRLLESLGFEKESVGIEVCFDEPGNFCPRYGIRRFILQNPGMDRREKNGEVTNPSFRIHSGNGEDPVPAPP